MIQFYHRNGFRLKGLFIRIFNLLFFPAKEWKNIAQENSSRKTVYRQFVAPLLCMMTIATIIGTWLATARELYTLGYIICQILILWTSLSAGLYISAYFLTEIMAQQTGERNHNRDFALMAYSSGAAYLVIIIVALFPFFSELYVLALYSCYLYWTGIPHIIRLESRERMSYALLSLIIMIVTYTLVLFLFDKILSSILL